METKDDLIMGTVRQFQRVAAKYARIEELPIPVEDGIEVTTREAHTIEAVGNRQQTSVTDVANAFGITKSAASQMVAKLRDKGFLEKKQAPFWGAMRGIFFTLERALCPRPFPLF